MSFAIIIPSVVLSSLCCNISLRNVLEHFNSLGNEMGYFTIDPVSGVITVSSEFPSITDTITFNLTVTATDQSSPFNVGTGYVVVTVLDAGEVPPVFVLPRYEADTLENREAGSFVVQVCVHFMSSVSVYSI